MDKIFRQAHEAFCDAEARTGSMNQMSSGLAQVFSALSNALTIIVACVMLAQGRMSFGALAVFSALQSTVSSGLSMALEAVPLMKSTRPIVERIQGMADSAPNPALAGRIVPTFREGIRTENLRFSYPEGAEVLRGISLTLRKGGKYAIVELRDYEKTQATIRLMSEIAKGRRSGEEEGWLSVEEVEKSLGITNE